MNSSYQDSLWKENMELRESYKAAKKLIYILIKRAGGKVVIHEDELTDETLNNKDIVTYIDPSDFSRVIEAK